MSKMLRNYQYLVGNNLDRQYEGKSLKEYIEGVTSSAIGGLTGVAPEELDTLGELAAAVQNNPDFLTALQGHDAAVLSALGIPADQQSMGVMTTSELPDSVDAKQLFEVLGEAARRLREGLGVAQGDSDMGTFTGGTIPDGASVKAALQALETTLEAVDLDTDDMAALAGLAENVADLGSFTGTLLSDGLSIKGALQEIETAIESAGVGDVATEAAARAAADSAIQADVDQNEADSDAADAALSLRLDTLEADPTTQTAVDAVNQSLTITLGSIATDVDQNEADADAADAALSGRLDTLEADPTTAAAVAAVQADVDQNELDSDAAEAALSGRLDVLEADPTTQAAVDAVQADVDANEAAADGRLDTLEANAAIVDPTTATALAAVQADVDQNEADADAAIALKADINSPSLTGTPAAPTATAGTSTTQVATTAFVSGAIADLVDGAPGTIDTLNEIATALGNDANLSTTLTNSIAAVQADVDQNELDSDAADVALDARIQALEADPTTDTAVANAIAAVQADVDQNEADADAAIAAVQADVDANEADADAAIAANEVHIDNLATLSGVAKDGTDLGSFTGSLIGDNLTVKAALQSLETSFETFDAAQGVADIVDGTTNFTGFKLQNTTVLATGAELNYVDGVTSNIQDQLDAIQADVDQNESDADAAIAAVQADVDQNESDADAAIAAVQADVDQNESDADAAIAAVQADVDQNEADADAAIAAVQADVDQNEADADAAIALKADIASPTFTGVPAAPTAGAGTNTTQLATTAFVSTAVANVIDSAPGALDTLNELAAALGDDENFSTTITNSIAAVQSDVDQNEVDGDAADAALSGRLDTLEADPTTATAVAAVQADVDQNEADADAAIAAVQADVDQNEADADAAIALKLDASAVSTFGGTLIDDADAATARTTLGLGTAATTAATAYATAAQGALADSAVQPAAISNIDNTSDADKPVSTATQTALDLKADLASPALTGTPTAPTAAADTNTTQVATTAYVQTEITDLIDGAPAGLNTLGEIATALQEDTSAVENLTTLINTESGHVDKLATLSGVAKDSVNLGTFTGSTVSDNGTVKAGMQELETQLEANHQAAALRTALGITENAGDPADGRGMYYDTVASKYLLSS